MTDPPTAIDLAKDTALTITWADGSVSTYPIAHLRRMSPSAEARELRKGLAENPLAILPSNPRRGGAHDTPLTATDAELVGHYAIRIRFSDGHDTGLYTWEYLRQIDPATTR
ncbi:MAG: DUF971 domain-containing protein [Phycisphaerales bacterium]|nr:DUF971 domain-containing protein [Phycisphaerales bacterium]